MREECYAVLWRLSWFRYALWNNKIVTFGSRRVDNVTFGVSANNKDSSQPPTRQIPNLPVSQSPSFQIFTYQLYITTHSLSIRLRSGASVILKYTFSPTPDSCSTVLNSSERT